MPSEKTKKSKTEIILRILLGAFLLVAIAFFAVHFNNALSEGRVASQEGYYDLLVENCDCLAHERAYCMEGFELSEHAEFCQKEGRVSNLLKGCSQFDCDGEIVDWNSKTKLWSPVLDFGE